VYTGYSKQQDYAFIPRRTRSGDSQWEFPQKAIDIDQGYIAKFPQLFL